MATADIGDDNDDGDDDDDDDDAWRVECVRAKLNARWTAARIAVVAATSRLIVVVSVIDLVLSNQ